MAFFSAPSIKSLQIKMRYSGQELSTGTAFVVFSNKGPLLITNRHNVTGRHQDTGKCLSSKGGLPNEIVIVHHKDSEAGETMEKLEHLFSKAEKPLWYEHPTLGERADFVALPLTDVSDVEINSYDIDHDPGIWIGTAEPVSVVGFPFGLSSEEAYAVWATGFIASEPHANFNGLPIFLIDCRTRKGQSGSAVIAHRGSGYAATSPGELTVFEGSVTKFLGIYSGRINNESDLGVVWKASAIKEMITYIEEI